MQRSKATIQDDALRTWKTLNDHLRSADEAECRRLLTLEKRGRKRKVTLERIFSRLNKVRGQKERSRLML